jgi:hypothetical protein
MTLLAFQRQDPRTVAAVRIGTAGRLFHVKHRAASSPRCDIASPTAKPGPAPWRPERLQGASGNPEGVSAPKPTGEPQISDR